MRLKIVLCALVALPGLACDAGVTPQASEDRMIPIVVPADVAGLVRGGETLVGARERLIKELRERAPHLLDDFTLKSLRGEHNAWVVGVDESDSDFAPLMGQIIRLTDLIQLEERQRRLDQSGGGSTGGAE